MDRKLTPPTFPALRVTNDSGREQSVLWCPWCEGAHWHGKIAQLANRAPHCMADRHSPLGRTGYVVEVVGQAETAAAVTPDKPFNPHRALHRVLADAGTAIRAAPRDDRDLIVAAINAHVLAMDNLSKVDAWLADGLCRLATGGGFSTRMLHTDKDEMVFMATRPIILNGIPLLTDRPDLADRAVTVRLKTIPEDERRPEDEFWQDWDAVAPRVLGALCDALSAVLRNIAQVQLPRSPRLADFAKWVTAAEPGLGWAPGTFLAAYGDNRRDVTDSAFEADPVAVAISAMMQPLEHGWNGTATELLAALNDLATDAVKRQRSWPATAQGLGNRLDRIAPLLRGKGLHIERRHSGVRTVTIVPVCR